MDRWLDSLSEDWVSQPAPSPPASFLNDSQSISNCSSTGNRPQSRIPRLKTHTDSIPPGGPSTARNNVSLVDANQSNDKILSERTLSKLNVPPRQSPNDTTKLDPDNQASNNALRSPKVVTESSPQSVQHHTIQHKPLSPFTNRSGLQHQTPEWKRRALRGEVGYGEQRDLFSPMGLESIFKPAATQSKTQRKRSRGPRVFRDDDFPSSPPSYTVTKQSHGRDVGSEMKFPGQGPLGPLEEQEEDHGNGHQADCKGMHYSVSERGKTVGDTKHGSSQNITAPTNFCQARAPADNRQGENHLNAINQRAENKDTPANLNGPQAYIPRNRTVSEEERVRNETISPIFLSTHKTVDGCIPHNAIDLSQQDLHQRIARLGLQNSLGPSTPSSDHEVPYGRVHGQDNLASPEHGLHDWTSLSLPDDLSISTDVFASKSGFVNARRRGYPNDISMQRRRLSFSSLLDIDQAESLAKRPIPNHQDRSAKSPSLFPAGFLATIHSAPPSAPLTAALLKTPTTSPHRDGASPVRLASSGSPLKLFGDYDTFTNERLLRRMSQFQAGSSEDSHEEMAHEVQGLSREHSKAEGTRTDTRGDVDDSALGTVLPKQAKRVSSFGEGQYHGYEFKEDISMVSSQSISSCDGSSNHPTLFRVEHLAGSPEIQGPGQVRQRRSDRASTKTSSTITRKWVSEVGSAQRQNTNQTMVRRQETIEEHHEVEGHAKGKRPPNSPAKDPAPKRRRTYDNVVNDFYAEEAHVAEQRPQQTQHIIGRKRKNARYDANNLEADPKVIALRQMLRPRTPSQTQNRSQRRDTVSLEDMVHGTPEPQDRTPSDGQLTNLDQEPESVETQTKAVAAELATFAIHAATSVTLDSRKPSITTQDFINEATKVMNIIRAKGKPPSGLSSIEQSDLEELEGNNQEHDEQSTKDEFSRPPSREGASIRMLRAPKQLDPRVLSHLRKFEEKDDVDIVMSSSLKTLDIQQQEHNKPNMSSVKSLIVTETGVESQPSNIRIFDDAHRERKRKHLSSPTVENPTGQSLHDVQSHMSQPSTGPSTERSIPTGSSRSSANKALIEPDKVSHLIPAQAAGMTYDHVQRTWIKRKESGRENTIDPSRPKSETTDEDPFEDIPDLSVDELEELKRVQLLKIQFKDGLGTPIEPDQRACEDPEFTEEKPATERLLESRPCTRDGTQEVPFDTSTIPSKYSHLVSSQPRTETRATSWGDEYVTTKVHPDKQEDSAETPPPPSGNREEEVEHEISILEGRLSKTPTRPEHLKHKARVVTVAFSSPLVSHVQKDEYEESPDRDTRSWTESCASPFENSGLGQYSGMRRNQRSASKRSSASSVQRSTHYGAPRQVSFAGQTFTARPISRIDELSEVSFGHSHVDVLRQSLDMAVSTPRPVPSTAGQRSNFSFHLSPLPEFSVHQLDESLQLDINHVAQRNGHISVQEVEGCFSLAVSELVKRIADVEPFEPYWEYIRKLNLQSAGMITLHQLREFCGRIEELDVADNELGQLNGAPSTIRHLKIQRNCLSNLTAWGHMSNLQYLDVSGNQIESLDGFSSLVHLRELRADDNKITNIEGIFDLDGLIALKLRRNCLGSVDFKGAELTRLAKLDISGNQLKDVQNLHCLPALVQLNLDHNELTHSPADSSNPLRKLQSLKIANNRLQTLDISAFPELRIIRLDRNRIVQADNLHNARNLETLCLRDQTLDPGPQTNHIRIHDCLDIRQLALSGNLLPIFATKANFLNLQHLELASCGLQTLPPNFGLKIANTCILNLNFNALKDIRPLLGINRLTKLTLAGNRLCRLRRTTAVVAKFQHLYELDLRNNPLSLGFYPPPCASTTITTRTNTNTNTTDTPTPPTTPSYDLAPGIKALDKQYNNRLDTDTRFRRRVYELLIANGCGALGVLDGLRFVRAEVGKVDWVLEKLVEIGVVRFREGEHGENKERKRDEGIEKNSGEQNNEVDEPGIDREQGEERIEERGINNKHSEQPFEA